MPHRLSSRVRSQRPLSWAATGLVVGLGLGALGVWAQPSPAWEAITASERGRFYIDPTSVRKGGGTVRFKTLLD